MPEKKEEQFTVQEEIKVEPGLPDSNPGEIVTTERKTPIKRGQPLTETHGMTTEANRFRET
jgi:hypothetical protein